MIKGIQEEEQKGERGGTETGKQSLLIWGNKKIGRS